MARLDGRLVEAEIRWGEIEDASSYPFSIPSIRSMRQISFDQPVTFLVGENGTGKSTLLEAVALAAGMNAEGGSRNLRFSTRSSHSSLHGHLTLSWRGRLKRAFFLRAESFYNVASAYEELFPTSLHERSHGESFLEAMSRHFWRDGLYLLDEPESALSLRGQLALLRHMHDRVAERCQFIVSTHSPILLAFPGARIYEMTDDGPRPVGYRDTDQYQMARADRPTGGRHEGSLPLSESRHPGGLSRPTAGCRERLGGGRRRSGRRRRSAGRHQGPPAHSVGDASRLAASAPHVDKSRSPEDAVSTRRHSEASLGREEGDGELRRTIGSARLH